MKDTLLKAGILLFINFAVLYLLFLTEAFLLLLKLLNSLNISDEGLFILIPVTVSAFVYAINRKFGIVSNRAFLTFQISFFVLLFGIGLYLFSKSTWF
ncbi:hypothetical protein A2976_01210 [candidate division WWE3 bacterium RIFCSPLOWO2_01_FULL_41_9]|uniref:Uncharacterized protein n=1 Tax=candidate division WWE3 bacterium RIFCSPLOWO2_01_FULL_41_9 TaxID=1802626 RepID=A0A1F4VGM8_UNCKA|nr:MAG: hypothetical protein A2976_01210 [candidate division WWE3 bacterium RIFCSPLOWO2_01_FULL_41_9]